MKMGLCVVVLVLVSVTGCGVRVESHAPEAPVASAQLEAAVPVVKSDFATRLEAARGIVNTSERDEACLHLSSAAAGAGDVEATKGALLLIVNTSTRDQAAYRASLLLAKNNRGEGANEVVKLIIVTSLQDEARAKIAKGDYSF
jgi:hypothetical protein